MTTSCDKRSCNPKGGPASGLAGEEEKAWTRIALTHAFRDWIHESPLSKCDQGVDSCPDWPLAGELADVALAALARSQGSGEGQDDG